MILIVLIAGVIGFALLPGTPPVFGGEANAAADAACAAEFAEGYEVRGVLDTKPPEIICESPGGDLRAMEMPRDVGELYGYGPNDYNVTD